MKQTAVSYLIEKLELKVMAQHIPWVDQTLQDALEMERNQIAEAWINSLTKGDYNSAEQYYTETYESND